MDVGAPLSDGTGSNRSDGTQSPGEHLFLGFVGGKAQHKTSAGIVLSDDPVPRDRDPERTQLGDDTTAGEVGDAEARLAPSTVARTPGHPGAHRHTIASAVEQRGKAERGRRLVVIGDPRYEVDPPIPAAGQPRHPRDDRGLLAGAERHSLDLPKGARHPGSIAAGGGVSLVVGRRYYLGSRFGPPCGGCKHLAQPGRHRVVPMPVHPARRIWNALETLHDVVYFSPEVRQAGVGLGLRGFWMTYFAFRAAPLGSVGAEPVIAAFAGFEPGMVRKALPDAWTRASPEACLHARVSLAASALRAAGVDERACAATAAILASLIVRADPTGRPLFAANAAVPPGDDSVEALWQFATSLREHRGDGHVAALVASGISGLEAHLLQVGAGRLPLAVILPARGWSEHEWAAAADRLRDRGLLSGDAPPALTDHGRACLSEIESATDNSAWTGALAPLGESGVTELLSLIRPAVRAVRASGILPAINPTGLADEEPRS